MTASAPQLSAAFNLIKETTMKNTNETPNYSRRRQVLIGGAAAAATLAAFTPVLHEVLTSPSPESIRLEALKGGHVDPSLHVRINPSDVALKIPAQGDDEKVVDTVDHDVKLKKALIIDNPVIVHGTDGKEYVMTVTSAETPAPTDLPSFAKQGRLYDLAKLGREQEQLTDFNAVQPIVSDTLPTNADLVDYEGSIDTN